MINTQLLKNTIFTLNTQKKILCKVLRQVEMLESNYTDDGVNEINKKIELVFESSVKIHCTILLLDKIAELTYSDDITRESMQFYKNFNK